MNFKQNILIAAALVAATTTIQAHAWDMGNSWGQNSAQPYGRSGDAYARGETLQNGDVIDALVLSVRPVTMEASAMASTTGMATGGVLGAAAGSQFGKGKGKYVTGALGAILGGGVGGAVGQAVGEGQAGEIIVELENGKKMFVVQADGMRFQPGQSVFLLRSAGNNWGNQGTWRVAPATAPAY